jgi:hypothetical protein
MALLVDFGEGDRRNTPVLPEPVDVAPAFIGKTSIRMGKSKRVVPVEIHTFSDLSGLVSKLPPPDATLPTDVDSPLRKAVSHAKHGIIATSLTAAQTIKLSGEILAS